jgi:hypothetical protein
VLDEADWSRRRCDDLARTTEMLPNALLVSSGPRLRPIQFLGQMSHTPAVLSRTMSDTRKKTSKAVGGLDNDRSERPACP